MTLILNKDIPLKDKPIIQIGEEFFINEELGDFPTTNFNEFCLLQEKVYKKIPKLNFLADKLKSIGKKLIVSITKNSVFVLLSVYAINQDLPCMKYAEVLPDLYLFEM